MRASLTQIIQSQVLLILAVQPPPHEMYADD